MENKIEEIEIENPYGFIYITTNLINGKKYIGQKQFNRGWKTYFGSGTYFKKAVKLYGKDNFIREIIAVAYSKEQLNKLEIEFINLHNAVKSDDYYNITYGGDLGFKGLQHSNETKIKMSKMQKGKNHPSYGKHPSEETKNKLRIAGMNRIQSEETKQKISEAQKGEKGNMYGKHHSEETKKKMSESHKNPHNYEIIKLMNKNNIKLNDEQIKEIRSKYIKRKYTYEDLAKEYFVSRNTIVSVIKHQGVYN